MLRQEAMSIAREFEEVHGKAGFRFNSLDKETGETTDGTEAYRWRATYVDESTPPQVIVERWWDIYTENDPEPGSEEDPEESAEAATDETDATVSEEVGSNGDGEQ